MSNTPNRNKKKSFLSPWLKSLTVALVGLLVGGLRSTQSGDNSGLILSKPSLPESDQAFKSSYGVIFAEASTYQLYSPPSLPNLEEVSSGTLPMPTLGTCSNDLVRYELTRDIQNKLTGLKERTRPLVEQASERQQSGRRAYHNFYTSPGTFYYFNQAQREGFDVNDEIKDLNRQIKELQDQTEEEITVLRQAARC